MGVSAAWTLAAITAASAYDSHQSAKKAASQQEQAMQQAKQASDAQATAADQEFNRMNQKKPNVAGIMAANAALGKMGGGSTSLTGPQGVDPGSLQLSKNTLLGS